MCGAGETFDNNILLTFLQMEAPEQRILAPLGLAEQHSQGPETQKTVINQTLHVKSKYQHKSHCIPVHYSILGP